MSRSVSRRPQIGKAKRTFHIVASRFNARYVQGLVDHATQELRVLVPGATISLHRVPGGSPRLDCGGGIGNLHLQQLGRDW